MAAIWRNDGVCWCSCAVRLSALRAGFLSRRFSNKSVKVHVMMSTAPITVRNQLESLIYQRQAICLFLFVVNFLLSFLDGLSDA